MTAEELLRRLYLMEKPFLQTNDWPGLRIRVADLIAATCPPASPADVIDIHSSAEYRVLVVGFVPGFAYLGALDERLALPRRESPRKRVPPGSVAIAERQTGIYPSATPGGWHIIGTTDEVLFDPRKAKPALFEVGDTVRFTR